MLLYLQFLTATTMVIKPGIIYKFKYLRVYKADLVV